MRKMTKRLVGLGAAAVVATSGAGAAYAAGWFTVGSGRATATAAQVQPLTVTVSLDPTKPLYPSRSVPATIMIDNAYNDVPVTVTSIKLKSVNVDDFHDMAGCGAENVEFTAPATLPTIPANDDVTLTGQVTMVAGAPAACQNAMFDIELKADAQVGG